MLPDVYFGAPGKLLDWRRQTESAAPDDDELLDSTPEDVVDILGFDPLELQATDMLPLSSQLEFQGLPITVEYPAGSQRTIRNAKGSVVYDRHMPHHYGFLNGTVGRDGDEIDVIVGPVSDAKFVYVADMVDRGPDIDQRQDEDKVLVGFASSRDAKRAFESQYGRNWLGGWREMTVDELKEWVA